MLQNQTLKLCGLVLFFSLCACSSRLDPQEAGQIAARASALYPTEFTERAPKLTPKRLHSSLNKAISALEEDKNNPLLKPSYLSAESPRFVQESGVKKEQTDLVTALCKELVLHDISQNHYACEDFKNALKKTQTLETALKDQTSQANLTPEQIQRLTAWLSQQEADTLQDAQGEIPDVVLISILFGSSDREHLFPEVDINLTSLRNTVGFLSKELAQIEVLAHKILVQYAWDMRAQHAGSNWERKEEHRKWLDVQATAEERRTRRNWDHFRLPVPKDWPSNARTAISRQLDKDMGAIPEMALDAWIVSLRPEGDQYLKLLQTHKKYRKFAREGGFTTLKNDKKTQKMRKGKRYAEVPNLRKRLEEEGFNPGQGDPENLTRFDGQLANALRDFQSTHQLSPTGNMNRDTLKTLQIPVEDKIQKIKLALQRWREAPLRDKKHIFVNIPDYHGEFWHEGKLVHRYRVVVGNTTRKYKRGKGRTMVNATPRMWASIDRVIYNPYWNIPERILTQEILNEESRDLPDEDKEAWLNDKGYEVQRSGGRWGWVRQPPGPGNALGQVKIIFPNPHDVYMHDTPSKKLFKRPRRAFSHGCMRVHQPLDLARKLLEYDNQYNDRAVRRLLTRRENTTFRLRERIPVVVDYITVRVDAEGKTHFLHDVYGLDKQRLASKD